MKIKGIAHRLVAQLHIALILIVYKATTANASSNRNKLRKTRRQLNSHFNMRLFWKKGYRWQESSSEKKFCMQCRSDRCSKGSGLKIEKCDKGNWRQHFYFDDGRIRSRKNKSVCLERDGRSLHLQTCNNSLDQKWDRLKKGEPFQLRVPGDPYKCASQHHHPKKGEKLYMTSCKRSVASETDKWIVY
mmetsp:Transcript_13485/g.22972  ORF Transcript_13485/g.22972 Transcript_13485/m.22972 type:complete len:188 (+) Transcript_13485:220-783(+)